MSETSVSVVTPPSGTPAITSMPLSRAIRAAHCSASFERMPRSSYFLNVCWKPPSSCTTTRSPVGTPWLAIGQTNEWSLYLAANLPSCFLRRSVALRLASVFMTASITSPDSRSRASLLCHTPSMCCRLDDRLLRVVEDHAVAAAIDHVGNQFLDEQITGRLAGSDQIRLVVALVWPNRSPSNRPVAPFS